MTKLLEEAVATVRKLTDAEQDAAASALFAHLAGRDDYWLSDAQIEEVRRTQRELREGRARLATDEEIAATWKKLGL